MNSCGSVRKENLTIGKIIALCLVAASFAALFFPWVTISVEVLGTKYTMQDIMSLVYADSGTSQSAFEAELRSSIESMTQEWAEEGVNVSADKMMSVVRVIMRGNVSPIECADICSFLSSTLGKIIKSAEGYSDFGALEQLVVQQLESVRTSITVVAVGLWILLALMAAAMGYAVYSLLADKKFGVAIYAGVSVVVFAVFAVAVNKVNNVALGSLLGIADMLEDAGIQGSTGLVDLKLFHLSAAPYVCMIGGLAALIAGKMQYIRSSIPNIDIALPTHKWVCICGASNSADNQFCYLCGKKKAEASACSCGAILKPGDVFCSKCGKKVGMDAGYVPAREPEPELEKIYVPVPQPKKTTADGPWQDLGDLL